MNRTRTELEPAEPQTLQMKMEFLLPPLLVRWGRIGTL